MLKEDIYKISSDAFNEGRSETIINDDIKLIHKNELDNDWRIGDDGFICCGKTNLMLYSALFEKDKFVRGFIFIREKPDDPIKYKSLYPFLSPNKLVKGRVKKAISNYANNL